MHNQSSSLLLLLRRISELTPKIRKEGTKDGIDGGRYSTGYNSPYPMESRSCAAAALKVAQLALASTGGQIYLFTGSNPTVGYAKFPHTREKIVLYGSEKELSMYGAIDKIEEESKDLVEKKVLGEYIDLANKCHDSCISVNIFLYAARSDEYRDVAVLSYPCEFTGGKLCYFTGSLHLEDNKQRFRDQLAQCIEDVSGYEAVMKIRTSVGMKISNFMGAGKYKKVEDELYLSTIDSNFSFGCSLQHTGNFKDEEKVHIQLAVLYTNKEKRRMIRVHNLTLVATSQSSTIYKSADLDSVVTLITKLAVDKALQYPLSLTTAVHPRAYISQMLVDVLYFYRQTCSAASPRTQLILPESLKLLPLYALGMLKHPALFENKFTPSGTGDARSSVTSKGGSFGIVSVRAHERAYELRRLRSASVRETIISLYPRLFVLHAVADNQDVPIAIPHASTEADVHNIPRLPGVSSEYFDSDGLYLLNEPTIMWLYIGRSVPKDDLMEWFGFEEFPSIVNRPASLSFRDDTLSGCRMQRAINLIRHHSPCKQGMYYM